MFKLDAVFICNVLEQDPATWWIIFDLNIHSLFIVLHQTLHIHSTSKDLPSTFHSTCSSKEL